MFKGIAFIGGIHGVGKSTICRQLCYDLNIEYLSASNLLDWNKINKSSNSKSVENISITQNRLIIGLQKAIKNDTRYLLDGHYCLLNENEIVTKVPLKIFEQINPISINIIIEDISKIKENLEKRDNKAYPNDLLEYFQEEELKYAKFLANKFGILLNIGKPNEYSELFNSLHKTFALI